MLGKGVMEAELNQDGGWETEGVLRQLGKYDYELSDSIKRSLLMVLGVKITHRLP